MAYTYLDLVNEICRKVNEVELTSSNFASAIGFYSHAKDGVNRALRDIDTSERFWPFNFNQGSESCVAGTSKYSFPAGTKIIDFGSFVIPEDATYGNETTFLKNISYDDYKHNYSYYEHVVSTTARDIPIFVVKSPSDEFILVPTPDQTYTVKFDYYGSFSPLSAHDDVPVVPSTFRNTIINGAMRDTEFFRENEEKVDRYESLFRDGIKDMRTALINENLYVRAARRFFIPDLHNRKMIKVG